MRITGLDHLVPPVADTKRAVRFYRRLPGRHPVSFGKGRRALVFDTSKINLHQLGRELPAPARRLPTRGSSHL